MDQERHSRGRWRSGCIVLGVAAVGIGAALYGLGTRPSREAPRARSELREGMTLVEVAGVLSRHRDWLCVMRPAGSDDERRVHLSRREDRVFYFGHPESDWVPSSAALDDRGALALANGMGSKEWVAHLQFVGLMMIYEFDITFDAGHRLTTVTAVRKRVPHE